MIERKKVTTEGDVKYVEERAERNFDQREHCCIAPNELDFSALLLHEGERTLLEVTLQSKNACILLAAGRSSRMGRDKLSLPFAGHTVLAACVNALRSAPFDQRIFVGRENPPAGFTAQKIEQPAPMHFSLRKGVEALAPGLEYFCVALADQPLLQPRHFEKLISAWEMARALGKDLVQPFSGRPGNPCLIHARYIPEILAHPDEDRGAYYLFQRHADRVHRFATSDPAFFTDIDTPEDYACATSSC